MKLVRKVHPGYIIEARCRGTVRRLRVIEVKSDDSLRCEDLTRPGLIVTIEPGLMVTNDIRNDNFHPEVAAKYPELYRDG